MMESKAHGRLPPQSYFYEFLQIIYSTFSFQDQQGYFLQMIPLTFMQGCLEDFSKKKKRSLGCWRGSLLFRSTSRSKGAVGQCVL